MKKELRVLAGRLRKAGCKYESKLVELMLNEILFEKSAKSELENAIKEIAKTPNSKSDLDEVAEMLMLHGSPEIFLGKNEVRKIANGYYVVSSGGKRLTSLHRSPERAISAHILNR